MLSSALNASLEGGNSVLLQYCTLPSRELSCPDGWPTPPDLRVLLSDASVRLNISRHIDSSSGEAVISIHLSRGRNRTKPNETAQTVARTFCSTRQRGHSGSGNARL